MLYGQLVLVLLAFAANSLLCRWALDVHQFDPALFSLVRLVSGAIVLSFLLYRFSPQPVRLFPWRQRRFWLLGLGLGVYALGFAWAYMQLDTGVGAFILFATVQIMMQLAAFIQGDRLSALQWLGVMISFAGLGWLLLPGAEAPDFLSAVLMFIAGLGWSAFVILGKQSQRPLLDVQQAFVAAAILTLVLFPWLLQEWLHWHWLPWVLALASGIVASGLGYFLWYRILPQLGLTRAAQYQLLVPVLALLMGMFFLQESLSQQSMMAMAVIIFGVTTVTLVRRPITKAKSNEA